MSDFSSGYILTLLGNIRFNFRLTRKVESGIHIAAKFFVSLGRETLSNRADHWLSG